jgi:hypothetical protein
LAAKLAAVLVVVVGWGICGMALYALALGSASVAAASFIVAIAVWVASRGASFRAAPNFYVFGASLASFRAARSGAGQRIAQHRIHTLTARRDQALRRTHDLQTYASFCLRESECWPEDSIDRAELVAYSEVASRLADESLREWREIERKLRAERFEQITSSAR